MVAVKSVIIIVCIFLQKSLLKMVRFLCLIYYQSIFLIFDLPSPLYAHLIDSSFRTAEVHSERDTPAHQQQETRGAQSVHVARPASLPALRNLLTQSLASPSTARQHRVFGKSRNCSLFPPRSQIGCICLSLSPWVWAHLSVYRSGSEKQ